jgi:hypothetical protein
LLAHGRWFSPGTAASSTTKAGGHDIAEILLKVALNTKNQSNQSYTHYLHNIKLYQVVYLTKGNIKLTRFSGEQH